MEIIVLAALITAFLAGVAALFAPCCIGVLLPAYFGSIFRQKKTVLLMTVIFFFGLLAVFLPLGLGLGFLGQLFQEYHNTIYLLTGIFFLGLGAVILLGIKWSLPFRTKSQVKVTGGASVFVLGMFSGFATLCCAPVLAGALALSVLPGSIFWGGLYSAVYALGMVFPLFIISYYLDKKGVTEKANIFKKEVRYRVFGKEMKLTISNLFSGLVFLVMGFILLYYTATNQITMEASESKLWVNIFMSKLNESITQFLSNPTGQIITLVIVVASVALLVRKQVRRKRQRASK